MSDPSKSRLIEAVLVTGNRGKLTEARRLCGVAIEATEIDLPEIQSLDIEEILRAKAVEAYRTIARPVIVDETALESLTIYVSGGRRGLDVGIAPQELISHLDAVVAEIAVC